MGFRGFRAFSALLLLLLSAAPDAFARGCLIEARKSLQAPTQDSAVELEIIDTNHRELGLLTTRDGSVGALLKKGEDFPPWFRDWAKKNRLGVKPRAIRWDDLSREQQVKLLQDLSRARKHPRFFDDRRIHGLMPRKTVTLTFAERTTFQGKTYEPGTHDVDLRGAITDMVEYSGPDAQKTFSGVELHFRARGTAAQVSDDARTLLKAAGIPPTHQHVHIVAALPLERLKANPEREGTRMGDFVRRANLAAEMTSILFRDRLLVEKTEKSIQYFGPLTPQTLEGATGYFVAMGQGLDVEAGAEFKIAWIGIRGHDKYDQPGLWGLEYRALRADADAAHEGQVMNALQSAMNDPEFGMEAGKFDRWYSAHGGGVQPEDLMFRAIYNRDWDDLVFSADARIAQLLIADGGDLERSLRALPKTGVETKMLVHNWADDPMVHGNPELGRRITDAQIKALTRLKKLDFAREAPIDVMKDFLLESGLYETTMRSIGVNVTLPK